MGNGRSRSSRCRSRTNKTFGISRRRHSLLSAVKSLRLAPIQWSEETSDKQIPNFYYPDFSQEIQCMYFIQFLINNDIDSHADVNSDYILISFSDYDLFEQPLGQID